MPPPKKKKKKGITMTCCKEDSINGKDKSVTSPNGLCCVMQKAKNASGETL